jgi:hypothetical protein
MDNQEMVDRGKQLIHELADILNQVSDPEAGELLGTGAMDDFIKAILDPAKVSEYPNIAEFFLANKNRAHLLALLRYAITHNYSIRGRNEEGQIGLVSPDFHQWFDDGEVLSKVVDWPP